MVDLRPDIAAFSRVAYLRELFGDTDGAIEMMAKAAAMASPRQPESIAWCRSQLGNLCFNAGRLDEAEAAYAVALKTVPSYHYALLGMGRVLAARHRYDEAIASYQRSIEIVPLHETVVALGDLYAFLHRPEEAAREYELVAVIQRLNDANKIRPDAQAALFDADHDRNLVDALKTARARAAEQKDIRTMDALAWTLFKNGDYTEALKASDESLRLGTRDAAFYFHKGMIFRKLGDPTGAAAALRQAIDINPYFDPTHADEALAALAKNGETPHSSRRNGETPRFLGFGCSNGSTGSFSSRWSPPGSRGGGLLRIRWGTSRSTGTWRSESSPTASTSATGSTLPRSRRSTRCRHST